MTAPTPITLADLSTATVDGTGVFDVLMRAQKAHLDEEFTKGRMKGAEYAQAYLGGLQATLQAATQFLLERDKAAQAAALTEAQTRLVEQQILNAQKENARLDAEICKLQAEFDLTVQTKLRAIEETTLTTWKTNTEKAQTIALGVDADSVVGKQKALYGAQADGFTRDAEQKVAKIMVDSWNVRRTTDDATVADGVNNLNDAAVGRAVVKLLTGVGA